ncbi:MAG: butyrate kinase [Firmicutes bacterium]|nr:butyrate kinase [Bacillota bacterium]MDD7603149.1 butyrate kinase [Bacillota bacterium]MDY5856213.1 butyrate kinase [Anaerovoracaceae bacterium]
MKEENMKTDILAINPGSTSSKVGVFRVQEDGSLQELFVETISHSPEELKQFRNLQEQQPYRKEVIESVLNDKKYDLNRLRAVVGRGGQLPDLKSGGYRIDPEFCADMMDPSNVQHASNLGAPLAYSIAEPLNIPSFIYDSTRGCELTDVARVSGLEGLVRYGNCHVLNSRAQAIRYARSVGKEYKDMHIIVCHMGGGITVSAHEGGRIIDDSSYDEGPMSPERTGGIQLTTWTELCCSGKYTEAELKKIICGKGGLYSYLGVTDCRQVERMIEEGNQKAAVVYESMAYQVAKSIAAMTIPLKGKVDAILLTGGAAHSKMLTGMIREYAGHLGEFILMPGENELEALAEGAWRILEGREEANTYQG